MTDIDTIDRKILQSMQEDARRTSEEVGDAVGLSATAVQRRLKRLRETGVLEREVGIVSPTAFGEFVTLIVEVVLAKGDLQILDRFKRRMRQQPEVQQCYHTMGAADLVLIVVTESVSSYEKFTRHAFLEDANVQHFKTTVVMERVKTGMTIPIPT